jgi:hypothetical protein
MYSSRNTTVGMNPITAKNNAIVTLHLDNKEYHIRLAPYGELLGDDTPGFHWVAPHAVKRQVGLHKLIIHPYKLLEDRVRHQVDGNAAINEHTEDRPSIDVTSNV